MTPVQLKKLTVRELLIIYQNKARCFYTREKAATIYNELVKRLDTKVLQPLNVAVAHLRNENAIEEFDTVCKNLIKQYK